MSSPRSVCVGSITIMLRPRATAKPSPDRYLVFGLGNPGREYKGHRHNAGFRCVERLASRHGIAITRKRFKALVGEGTVAEHKAVLLKPQTFMNDSGLSVAPASHWFKVPASRIIVMYDDLDLPLGKVRVRPGGSSGGHHGIESIIRELGDSEFTRVRVGIGRPERGDPIDYVLSRFSPEQEPVIDEACALAVEAVECILAQGIKAAMNAYNGRSQ